MDDPGVKLPGGSPATNAVWVFRIVLPILLFVLWYRLQVPATGTGGGRGCYKRDLVLAARPTPEEAEDDVPDCLQGLRLVDEATAQRLLGLPPPRVSSSSAGGGRRDSGKGARQRVGRMGSEGRRSGDFGEGPLFNSGGDSPENAPFEAPLVLPADDLYPPLPGAAAEVEAVGLASLTPEERANHAALLNFLALGRGRRQRTFLHDEEHPPPPPPRSNGASVAEAGAVARANLEAQSILRGLLQGSKSRGPALRGHAASAEVPRRLHAELSEHLMPLDAPTFALLVESSASAGDLQTASDFLMKMENAGHCAGNELLDMVMDLYAEGSGKPGTVGGGSWAEMGEEKPF